MTNYELEIDANDVISYFCQQLRIGWVLCPENLKYITPKPFPKQACFHRSYWKSKGLNQEKQLPDKGKNTVHKACLHRLHVLLPYNITKLRDGDLTEVPGGVYLISWSLLFCSLSWNLHFQSARSQSASLLICMSVWVPAALAVAKRI